jgi:hypothetical protein
VTQLETALTGLLTDARETLVRIGTVVARDDVKRRHQLLEIELAVRAWERRDHPTERRYDE